MNTTTHTGLHPFTMSGLAVCEEKDHSRPREDHSQEDLLAFWEDHPLYKTAEHVRMYPEKYTLGAFDILKALGMDPKRTLDYEDAFEMGAQAKEMVFLDNRKVWIHEDHAEEWEPEVAEFGYLRKVRVDEDWEEDGYTTLTRKQQGGSYHGNIGANTTLEELADEFLVMNTLLPASQSILDQL